MKIEIKAHNFTVSDGLRAFVNHRLALGLRRHRERIRQVTVRLADINGPRGGIDKHCTVQIALYHLPDVLIEDVEADLHQAISRAADRASRTVTRRLARQQDRDSRAAELADSDVLDIEPSRWIPPNPATSRSAMY
ncbi:HPF/RaiA family ribosome-associated protein [Chitinimonas sp. BJYL2]|uniref:HPF/RaiA family ribosome-associated protein n=1 Tax=Chitinimonas sp. BJYL2 TaxID=2976696 RepID=UPI0022B5798C|nr:HPF/RaiA family ribosome-associated protein [Chitinimonas sp. BJYL2]